MRCHIPSAEFICRKKPPGSDWRMKFLFQREGLRVEKLRGTQDSMQTGPSLASNPTEARRVLTSRDNWPQHSLGVRRALQFLRDFSSVPAETERNPLPGPRWGPTHRGSGESPAGAEARCAFSGLRAQNSSRVSPWQGFLSPLLGPGESWQREEKDRSGPRFPEEESGASAAGGEERLCPSAR